jgi:hypothetical protein
MRKWLALEGSRSRLRWSQGHAFARSFVAVALTVFASSGCGGAGTSGPADDRGANGEDGELGTTADPLMVGPNTLIDLYNIPFLTGNWRAREMFMGRSTAVIVDKVGIADGALRYYQLDMCDDEELDNQRALKKSLFAGCSSALVGDSVILTAQHCLFDVNNNPAPLGDMRVVFGWDVHGPVFNTQADPTVSPDDIYTPVSVVAQGSKLGSPGDWALIQLDRPVSPQYRRLRLGPSPRMEDRIFAIGYPLDMAVKYSTPGRVWQATADGWRASISGQSGNSGSPVFDATSGAIAGVLAFGPDDFVRDDTQQCNRWYQCPSCGMGGPGADDIAPFVPAPAPSCAGACNGQSPDGCFCDAVCNFFGDCCPDAVQCEPYWNPGPGSCAQENACGGNGGGCWCDTACPGYGDCCADYFQTCGRAEFW